MVFLQERDFSRDQPCETRLLPRLESRMVSWEKFAEVVGTRRVSGERHVLYLTSYVCTQQFWSRMSRETGLARRDHGLAVSSRVSSRKVSQRDATLSTFDEFADQANFVRFLTAVSYVGHSYDPDYFFHRNNWHPL